MRYEEDMDRRRSFGRFMVANIAMWVGRRNMWLRSSVTRLVQFISQKSLKSVAASSRLPLMVRFYT